MQHNRKYKRFKYGAVLYGRDKGILVNVAYEEVAQIQNAKIRKMVDDVINNSHSRLSTLRVKYVLIENDNLYCNMGFWTDNEDNVDDDDIDDDIDDDDIDE